MEKDQAQVILLRVWLPDPWGSLWEAAPWNWVLALPSFSTTGVPASRLTPPFCPPFCFFVDPFNIIIIIITFILFIHLFILESTLLPFRASL